MFSISLKGILIVTIPISMVVGVLGGQAFGQHSASAFPNGPDAIGFPNYIGNSRPTGVAQNNVFEPDPGYLNDIAGGGPNGASGNVSVSDPNENVLELVGLAVRVADDAGDAHSLSNLGDPALNDIIFDLNHPAINGFFPFTAFAFNSVPAQFTSGAGALLAGEATNGGEPFDILLVSQLSPLPIPRPYITWSFDFAGEIGNLDGITAIGVTDVGALPEPTPFPIAIVGIVVLLNRRAHCRVPCTIRARA